MGKARNNGLKGLKHKRGAWWEKRVKTQLKPVTISELKPAFPPPISEKFQGRRFEWIIFDEIADMPMSYESDKPFTGEPEWLRRKKEEEQRQLGEILQITLPTARLAPQAYLQRPSYSSQVYAKLADTYLIQFIGGPMNSQQIYLPRKDYRNIRPDQPFTWLITESIDDCPFTSPETVCHTTTYLAVFVPPSDATFCDEQLVIALYRG